MDKKLNISKWIPIVTALVVVALCFVALIWDHGSEPQVPSDDVVTGPTSKTELSATQPSEVAPTNPPPDDDSPEHPSDQPPPTDPTQQSIGTEPSASWPFVPAPSDPTVVTDPPPDLTEKDKLSVDKFAKFSGRFVEDATDKPIEDVAAILVTNRSDRFLDIGTIGYTIDGKKATFIVTGLPAGASCWIMEYTGLTVEEGADLQYQVCDTSFREGVEAEVDEVTIRFEDGQLFATNETARTLKNVFIYYKNVHTDGNFFGGITYMVEFGDLEPGRTVNKIGGHFTQDGSQIVRIGWQEVQTEEGS